MPKGLLLPDNCLQVTNKQQKARIAFCHSYLTFPHSALQTTLIKGAVANVANSEQGSQDLAARTEIEHQEVEKEREKKQNQAGKLRPVLFLENKTFNNTSNNHD